MQQLTKNAYFRGIFGYFQILAAPFAWTNEAVDMERISGTWQGEIKSYDIGSWLDKVLLCIFGGIPWQVRHNGLHYMGPIWNLYMGSILNLSGHLRKI